jgi:hypothetical protein
MKKRSLEDSDFQKASGSDFYVSGIAPRNHHREARLCAVDFVMMVVLFFEIGGLLRIFLAN